MNENQVFNCKIFIILQIDQLKSFFKKTQKKITKPIKKLKKKGTWPIFAS